MNLFSAFQSFSRSKKVNKNSRETTLQFVDIYDFCLFHLNFFSQFFSWFLLKNPDFAPDRQVFSPMGRGVAPPPPSLPPLEEPRSECYKLFCGCDKTPCFFGVKNTHIMWIIGIYFWTFPSCCYRIYAVFFFVNFIRMVNSRDFPVTSCKFDGANAEFSIWHVRQRFNRLRF